MPTALLVGSYIEPNEVRMREYAECLSRNIANPFISKIHVFVEEEPAAYLAKVGDPPNGAVAELGRLLAHDKIARVVKHGKRTLFSEFFAYANEHLADRTVCISNADIFFDNTLGLLDGVDLTGCLICLAKYHGNDLNCPSSSHDSWIFVPPIRVACDWYLGRGNCDWRLAYEASASGLKLYNPCLSVKAHHHHLSEIRNPREAYLNGNFLHVPPCDITVLPEKR